MTTKLRQLQGIGLRLTLWLPESQRAVWLTTFYELYRTLRLGHIEPWLLKRANIKKGNTFLRNLWPKRLRELSYSLAHIYRLHRQGHVLPGVWTVLDRARKAEANRAGLPREAFPEWMVADLRRLSDIEASMFPDNHFFAQFHAWSPHADSTFGLELAEIWEHLPQRRFDVVLLAPWVRIGGADKGLRQYLEYYCESFDSVLLLTTYPRPSTQLAGLPQKVVVHEVGMAWQRLRSDEQVALLTRLVLTVRPKIVHNVLSEMAWNMFAQHGKTLRANGAKLVASLFTEETDAIGARFGYPVDFLPLCRTQLDALITDSRAWARMFHNKYVLSDIIVAPIHFYINLSSDRLLGSREPHRAGKVLWAGRLCPQKLPEVLLDVARLLPNVEFNIYGPTEPSCATTATALKRLPNVVYHGEYSDFHKITTEGAFDCLLYTTAFDGMPNVILEAANEFIPIIAPCTIGGLSDLLDDTTCEVVKDNWSASDYATAVERVLDNRDAALAKAKEAHRRLTNEFNRSQFTSNMQQLVKQLIEMPDITSHATARARSFAEE